MTDKREYTTNTSHNRDVNNRKLSGDPLFEMPPFPPWNNVEDRTTNERSLSTPLRRKMKRSLKVSIDNDSLETCPSIIVSDEDAKNELKNIEYDYQPFTTKKSISETKKKNWLSAETAEHCLVFHKEGHLQGAENYRPDIMIDCVTESASGSDILIDYPENIKDSYKNKVRKSKDIGNNMQNREHKSATKLLELKIFWENSDLLNHLDTDMVIRQNEILLRELDELINVKKQLKNRKHHTSLRERCEQILNGNDDF
ncbi:similar to Saccharomyces cerevisiae YLR102C APC9 Subunit of the Anaphase-Promoting Complex/Cyclosome (APC/C) [Maudiozyma barnettii]|uniref:Similar to Saccharomyces cerevisiae YLR102C APC9 Subunit of the Anaphase-Promoting Complex/Cyclosome (APC/C) n=1 Tax=Maudiozyma barnettii TaxID=61262 RepID=A0A8H2VGY9_9SACH|nr:anaphase promoting complex subunit 9 [Kazachstania barnettii]CAB4255469.1 similar to Saccharomyces cerevisiae YLR102C APC9 Subunit of the Anaphase-Promoting Complex/Cyclosome (APC/C) [Kazachstania barnettii]CAD1783941.1 similar to Saccharomyces cerevisiae YLR102C APC9 Subunit of the Anaphase-Promoting Complex/Cyclosome (APC/C) [Kazachstania barnettii]